MRVALFVHCFFPDHFYGTETYTLDLARNLRELGHDPVVVSAIFPGEPGKPEVVSQYEYEGVPVYCIDKNHYPHTRVKDTYYQPALRGVLRDLLVKIAPDIVHVTHLINHTAVLLEIAHELSLPTIATLTDFFGFCYNNKLEAADGSLCSGPNPSRTNCLACYLKARAQQPAAGTVDRLGGTHPWSSLAAQGLHALHRLPGLRAGRLAGFVLDIKRRPDILKACYAHYRAVIAPTRFLCSAYRANGLQAPVTLIRFGVDFQRSPKPARKPEAPIRFAFIGQLARHKGTDILIDAFSRLPIGTAELHIFGPEDQDPEYMAELKAKADGRPVWFRGTFPGARLAAILAEIDFLVIPSRWYENSPLVLLNALASHTPVIVSDVEGMTEFVEEGKNGFVFARGSVRGLEQVLKSIIDRPAQAHVLSASTGYPKTTRAMTEKTLEVYARVRGSTPEMSSNRIFMGVHS